MKQRVIFAEGPMGIAWVWTPLVCYNLRCIKNTLVCLELVFNSTWMFHSLVVFLFFGPGCGCTLLFGVGQIGRAHV